MWKNCKWLSDNRRNPGTAQLTQEEKEYRSEFDRDLGRLMHSSSFRRLQGKTQVWGVAESDFFRTRLTHSLEASQVGMSLAAAYGLPRTAVVTACLAHDIGHPPFGHDGAEVLNDFAKKVSDGRVAFDDNAQNLRVVSLIENYSGIRKGLNLTAATLDGMIKYKKLASAGEKKAGYYAEDKDTYDWIVSTTGTGNKRSPVVMFVELADDIAYACHDLEDAMRSSFIRFEDVAEAIKVANDAHGDSSIEYKTLDLLRAKLQEFSEGKLGESEHFRLAQKRTKAFFVNRFIQKAIACKDKIAQKMADLNYDEDTKRNLFLDADPDLRGEIKVLKKIVESHVIMHPDIQNFRHSSRTLLGDFMARYTELFKPDFKCAGSAYSGLPRWVQDLLSSAGDGEAGADKRLRVMLDYVAGMTDTYLIRQATQLYHLNTAHAAFMRR